MFDLPEAATRWARVRKLMDDQDLDLVLAIDWSRDEILKGHQRWLTGFTPTGGPAALLMHRDGDIELIAGRVSEPVARHYQERGFPITLVGGFSPPLVAEHIKRRRPGRLGIAEAPSLPFAIAEALTDGGSAPEIVDLAGDFQRLRLQKTPYELDLVRTSCDVADRVWRQVSEVFAIGRRIGDVVADIDRLVRFEGGEGGYNLILELPFHGRPVQPIADPAVIEADSRYLVEVSPRYEGYYSQLTIPVTTCAADKMALDSYEAVVEAKRVVQPYLRAGEDLTEVAQRVADLLNEAGHTMTSLSLGHFCGMCLTEPRHDPRKPFILEPNMTLIFHPVIARPEELYGLMRADTYLVGETGAERLTNYEGGVLTVP